MFHLVLFVSLLSTCFAAPSSDLAHFMKELPSLGITASELALSMMPITSIMKSESTSTIALQQTRLTGYIQTAQYTDSNCRTLSEGLNTLLNGCYYDPSQELYYSNFATATEVTFRSYSDFECKTLVKIQSIPIVAPRCTLYTNGKYYVNTVGTTKAISSINPTVYLK
jgi:hypothetical protein